MAQSKPTKFPVELFVRILDEQFVAATDMEDLAVRGRETDVAVYKLLCSGTLRLKAEFETSILSIKEAKRRKK